MRLQGVRDGRLYATDGRNVHLREPGERFRRIGRLPVDGSGLDGVVDRALTATRLQPLTDRLVGRVATVNLWPLPGSALLATLGRTLLRSADGGRRWAVSRRLPASSGPMGVLPSAVTHVDGTTYLGEYPLDGDVTPRILASPDEGRSWSTLVALPDVRHVHAVQRDPYTDDVWVTTGDTDRAARIGRLRGGDLEVVGGGSQDWRAVELAFTPDSVLWGVDCAYAEENPIFRLDRSDVGAEDPPIEAVHALDSSVYYAAGVTVGDERWVTFSTAMEAGRDSTGPATQRRSGGRGVVVAASESSGFTDWRTLASYERRHCLADLAPTMLPRANGYVFLAADPALGLLLNPFNTSAGDGSIQRLPPDRLADRRLS